MRHVAEGGRPEHEVQRYLLSKDIACSVPVCTAALEPKARQTNLKPRGAISLSRSSVNTSLL